MFRPLLFWLALLELAARRRRWHGMTWMHGLPTLVLALLAGAAFLRGRPLRLAVWVAALAPLALPLQIGLASIRNHRLNPLRRLETGRHADRTITRVDVPMPDGTMPALYIVPDGGARAAVCVLHGSGCDKTYYAWRLADALVSRGIATLLVDLDGHGESLRIQRFPQMLENATEGAAWLRERHTRVGLVGVSLGGCIAARAVADGLAIDALALLEAPPQLSYTRDDMLREAWALTEPFLLDLFGESTAYHLGYTVYDLIRVQSGPRIRCEIGTVDLIAALDLCASLPRITAPLLLIYGGRDSIVRVDQAAQARRAAPLHARFERMAEASHLTLILHPRALATLGEWMREKLER